MFCETCRGTEKQHVANNYEKHLHVGAVDCHGVFADAVGQYLVSKTSAELPEIERCEYLNISVCPATETNNVRYGLDSRFLIKLVYHNVTSLHC